jgi:CRP-like cAMP-binding protein
VESLNDTVFIAIKYSDLNKYAKEDAKFLRFVVKNLSHKLYTTTISNSINLLQPLENRFACYLLSVSTDESVKNFNSEIRTSKLTELANLLGTSYRHLNRVICDMDKRGIIG